MPEKPGYIYFHRKVLDNPLLHERPLCLLGAWSWMLLTAYYKDGKVKIGNRLYLMPRGSFFMSQRDLAKEWEWPQSKVNRWLKSLEKDKMITRTAPKPIESGDDIKVNQVNICNYEVYQKTRITSESLVNHPSNNKGVISKVIKKLNILCGTSFEPKGYAAELINARIGEGYKEGDFIIVIEKKHREWANDPGMCKYLRPSTLFRKRHFPEYLGQMGSKSSYDEFLGEDGST